MNKYRILINGYANAEVFVEADKALITANGDLKFATKSGMLTVAYSKGYWDFVELIQPEPTPEQIGTPTELIGDPQ